jgi:hypothetical protein
MKIQTTVDSKPITIKLTDDQLKEINRQQNIITSSSDINTYEDALKVLGEAPKTRVDDKIYQIIKAANYLDNNNKEWIPDFSNASQSKYYPYFNLGAYGWVVGSYSYNFDCARLGFGGYFKSSELALYAGNQFLDVYKDYLPE